MLAQAFNMLHGLTGSVQVTGPVDDGRGKEATGFTLPLPGAALGASGSAAVPAFDVMAIPGLDIVSDAVDYWVDSTQRWILFWDCLRRSGNGFLLPEDEAEPGTGTAQAPVAGAFGAEAWRVEGLTVRTLHPQDGVRLDPDKRPIVVFDPRTGTDAGEGGVNETVRQALYAGHFVYHAALETNHTQAEPAPSDLEKAEAAVLKDVALRHPGAPHQPCRIGRCADIPNLSALCLLAAENVGAETIDAVPSSYWCGLDRSSPFHDQLSLLGGQWVSSLDRDLGDGRQDSSMRACAPFLTDTAERLWSEPYELYAAIDTDDENYLERARRRDRVFKRRTDAGRFCVAGPGLAGGTAQAGLLQMDDGTAVDLRTETKPLLLFAADFGRAGAAALLANAVKEAFHSVAAIRRAGRVVVYSYDEASGQLTFLLTSRTPHDGAVQPGLYEYVTRHVPHADAAGTPVKWDLEAALTPRTFRDAAIFSDAEPVTEPSLQRAAAVSEGLDWNYKVMLRPWVRFWSTRSLGDGLRALRPARAWRAAVSDANIAMPAIKALAAQIREDRRPAALDNDFVAAEQSFARQVGTVLTAICGLRDTVLKAAFRMIFDNAFWPLLGR